LGLQDKRILQLINNSDNKELGFELLVKKYTTKVYWVVKRMVIINEDTEDLLQEIFLKIWKNIDKFKGNSELYTWIYRIAVNETINFINHKKKKFLISIDDYTEKQISAIETDTFFPPDTIEKRLHKAITSLPPKQKAIFELRYFENLKHEQIAEILGISIGNVKSQYHNAVEKIKKMVTIDTQD